ncbi:MAG: class I SAM-dependent methyltransferase [Saprospiraceae bacterium]
MFIANLPFYKNLSGARSNHIAQKVAPLLPQNAHVLDFGAGNMYTAKKLIELRPDLTILGLDVVFDQNLQLDQANSNITFQEYPGGAIPFESGKFDAVLACSAMHHTPDPEFYLDEFERVLKPNGTIVLVEEMYINPLDFVLIAGQDWILNKMKKGVPVPLNFRSNKHYLAEFTRRNWTLQYQGALRPGFPWQHHYVYSLSVK